MFTPPLRPGRRRSSHLGGLRFTTYSYTRETPSCGLDSLATLHFLQPGNHLKSFVKIAAFLRGTKFPPKYAGGSARPIPQNLGLEPSTSCTTSCSRGSEYDLGKYRHTLRPVQRIPGRPQFLMAHVLRHAFRPSWQPVCLFVRGNRLVWYRWCCSVPETSCCQKRGAVHFRVTSETARNSGCCTAPHRTVPHRTVPHHTDCMRSLTNMSVRPPSSSNRRICQRRSKISPPGRIRSELLQFIQSIAS